MEEDNLFKTLSGKLRINWGESNRAWNQIAGNGDKKIEYEEFKSLNDLIPNKEYLKQDLHRSFGGNQQAGIVYLPSFDAIFLINSPGGKVFGYEDGWSEGVYKLSGEGMIGDQKISKGNKRLYESIGTDKRIFLFEPIEDKDPFSHILHRELRCVNFEETIGLDKNQDERLMYKFHFQDVNHPSLKLSASENVIKEIKEKLTEELIEEISDELIDNSTNKTSVGNIISCSFIIICFNKRKNITH